MLRSSASSKFIATLLLLCSVWNSAVRAEAVTIFDPIGDVTIKLSDKFFTGVLFSEEERIRYIRLELEYNSKLDELTAANLRIAEQKFIYDELFTVTKTSLDTIEKLARKETESFFEKYDNVIFFGIGVVLTTLIVVAVNATE